MNRRSSLPRTRILVASIAAALVLAPAGCAGTDPVPLGTPVPPVVITSPKPLPTLVPGETTTGATPALPAVPVVPAVPIRDSDPAAQVRPAAVPPTHLTVASVAIDMQVLPMGVDDAGAMELPEDSGQAGWYEYGPAPADSAGTTVIAAHVDSLEFGLGQFVRLRDITAGEKVDLSTADGLQRSYTVEQITRTPKSDVALDEIFDRSGAPRLILVTCGGVFDRSTGHYLDNVIVTAIPDP